VRSKSVADCYNLTHHSEHLFFGSGCHVDTVLCGYSWTSLYRSANVPVVIIISVLVFATVPTENSVCPSTIRQRPCSIVTFGVFPEGRTVGPSIWMLLILTLFACDIILANHRQHQQVIPHTNLNVATTAYTKCTTGDSAWRGGAGRCRRWAHCL
jgi:hypothetical protein